MEEMRAAVVVADSSAAAVVEIMPLVVVDLVTLNF
jgi:hypothetical protein